LAVRFSVRLFIVVTNIENFCGFVKGFFWGWGDFFVVGGIFVDFGAAGG
jgi:hypothetical protein